MSGTVLGNGDTVINKRVKSAMGKSRASESVRVGRGWEGLVRVELIEVTFGQDLRK